jgi:hypothetical protein
MLEDDPTFNEGYDSVQFTGTGRAIQRLSSVDLQTALKQVQKLLALTDG